jgi:hypothetical protein
MNLYCNLQHKFQNFRKKERKKEKKKEKRKCQSNYDRVCKVSFFVAKFVILIEAKI